MPLNLTLPTVGGSQDTWGQTTNTALTAVQDAINGSSGTVSPDLSALKINGTTVTSTADELSKLSGFTGTQADLNYAKDLRATGVTSTEFDYLDGVTSNIQTQIDNAGGSVSGNTFATDLKIGRDSTELIDFTTNDRIVFRVNNSNEFLMFDNLFRPGGNGGAAIGEVGKAFSDVVSQNANIQGNITASGAISASGQIHTFGGKLNVTDRVMTNNLFEFTTNHGIKINNHITASGNISASGHITASGIQVAGALIPDTDSVRDLGSTTKEWRNLFVDGVAYLDAAQVGDLNVETSLTSGGKYKLHNGQTITPSGTDYVIDARIYGFFIITANNANVYGIRPPRGRTGEIVRILCTQGVTFHHEEDNIAVHPSFRFSLPRDRDFATTFTQPVCVSFMYCLELGKWIRMF